MDMHRADTPKVRSDQGTRMPKRGREEAERADQKEPGAGGLSKAEYDEATEEAVKDIHG